MRFNPPILVALLESCHVRLRRDGFNIRYRSPRGFTTEEIRIAIRRHKQELLPVLPAWEGDSDARD